MANFEAVSPLLERGKFVQSLFLGKSTAQVTHWLER